MSSDKSYFIHMLLQGLCCILRSYSGPLGWHSSEVLGEDASATEEQLKGEMCVRGPGQTATNGCSEQRCFFSMYGWGLSFRVFRI